MTGLHFLALLPMFIMLVLTLIFRRSGIIHLITLAYATVLGFTAILGSWEALLFAPIVGTILISLMLFIIAMTKGEWL